MLLIVFVLLLGAFVVLVMRSEVVKLAASGGLKELRDPLRPIRGETRVLLIGLDGVGSADLYESIETGTMPNVAALLGSPADSAGLWAHAYGARGVMSVLPAETTAGWTAVLTGAPPAESGVPGNEWFVRDSLTFFAPVPLSVESLAHTLRIYTDGIVGAQIQVPTLFERVDDLRSHVALGFVARGADIFTPPDFSRLPDLLQSLWDAAFGRDSADEELYSMLDHHAVTGTEKAAEAHGLPDLQFAYFPGVDLLTHVSESPIERQHTYLAEVIDPAVGSILDLYRSHDALETTYVVFVADHGHTPHLNDDEHSLTDEPLALLDSLGRRVHDPELGPDEAARYDAVFAANEAFSYVYLADGSTCPSEGDVCDWSRPPRLEEDILPVARGFREANESGAMAPAMRGTLDLIFVRDPSDGPAAPYRILDADSLVAIDAYLTRQPRPDLAHLEERLGWLADGSYAHHAGDIALLAKDGPERPIDERYYFASPQFSGHGSAGVQDGEIPLLIAQPTASGDALRDLLHEIAGPSPTQLSVTPLVEALLERNELAPGQ